MKRETVREDEKKRVTVGGRERYSEKKRDTLR